MESQLYEAELKAIGEAAESVSADTWFVLEEQTKKAAANCLIRYGDDALKAGGFLMVATQLAEAGLAWLLAKGYVELTEKAKVTDDELRERAGEKDKRTSDRPARLREQRQGQYL